MRVFKCLLVIWAYLFGNLEAAATRPNKTDTEGWQNAFSDKSSMIPLLNFGEKSYYFGIHFTATFLEADQFCRDIHMELVRVQSSAENDKLYKYAQKSTNQEHFWTAGSKLLDKKNWIWMTTGEIVDYTNWGSWGGGQPDHPNTELCLELRLLKNKGLKFNDIDCNANLGFICERDNRRHYGSHYRSDSNWSGVFANPSVSPNIDLLHFEGKSYYLATYFRATFLEAFQFCEMINMKLVSITSDSENNRIHKYIRDSGIVDTFWSSGSKAIDGKTWIWFSYGTKVDYTHWLPRQPDNAYEQCLQLEQIREEGLLWNDLTCTEKLFFICEKDDRVLPSPPPPPPEPIIPPTTDPTATVDGITYRVSKIKATQGNASEICKQYEMELASIQNKKKNDIITTLTKLSGNSGGDNYWTSGKKQSDGKWVWWDLQPVTYTNWAKGEPNNLYKYEFCLELYPNGQWNDFDCNREFYFICESPIKECASQPVINLYVNNNQCSNAKNGTVTETKKISSTKDGESYNVEINNNIETCAKTVPHK